VRLVLVRMVHVGRVVVLVLDAIVIMRM